MSAMHVSDTLLGDLSHLLKASGVAAQIVTQITSNLIAISAYPSNTSGLFPSELIHQCTLTG